MEPVTVGIIALLSLLGGAGGGGAVVAHKKDKKIADLQGKLKILQDELVESKKREAVLAYELKKSQDQVILLEALLLKSHEERRGLIELLNQSQTIELNYRKLIWLLITLRLFDFLRSRDDLIAKKSSYSTQKLYVESYIEKANLEKNDLVKTMSALSQEKSDLQVEVKSKEDLVLQAEEVLRKQS
ncbi:MAG: hypothetical protein JSU04_20140 [Bdellovibrionales bacterium]|nr:hypothetical protein [Bdellovibrionales bacterium]